MASCLVDTCVLLWATSDPDRLSRKARRIIEDTENGIFVSHATLWEISIKVTIGKLSVPRGFFERIGELGYGMIATKEEHFSIYRRLPLIHRDPFDRLLIAQSISEKIPLITCDPEILKYRVETIW